MHDLLEAYNKEFEVTKSDLLLVIQTLVETGCPNIGPFKMLLFGSRAHGITCPFSDADTALLMRPGPGPSGEQALTAVCNWMQAESKKQPGGPFQNVTNAMGKWSIMWDLCGFHVDLTFGEKEEQIMQSTQVMANLARSISTEERFACAMFIDWGKSCKALYHRDTRGMSVGRNIKAIHANLINALMLLHSKEDHGLAEAAGTKSLDFLRRAEQSAGPGKAGNLFLWLLQMWCSSAVTAHRFMPANGPCGAVAARSSKTSSPTIELVHHGRNLLPKLPQVTLGRIQGEARELLHAVAQDYTNSCKQYVGLRIQSLHKMMHSKLTESAAWRGL